MNPETYTAQLHDRPFGPAVDRIVGLLLVDGRPEPVIRQQVERDGRQWTKVYDLESWARIVGPEADDAPRQIFTYVLSSEGPAPGDDGSDPRWV